MPIVLSVGVAELLFRADRSRSAWRLVRGSSPGWLALCVAATAATYAMAAVGMIGATRTRLRTGPTLIVQIASAFTNRLAPSGLGGTAINVRFLEHAGVTRPQAVASVTLNLVAGLIVHVLAFLAILPFFRGFNRDIDPSDDAAQLIGVTILLVVAGVVIWARIVPRRWKEPLRTVRSTLTATLRMPDRAAALFGGSAGVTAGHAIALWCALHSVGATTSVVDTAVVYLAAAAIGSISPTPGGLGAFEAALVTGLSKVATQASTAAAAVVVYRLISFWLPVLPGVFAFGRLRRRGLI
jgi:undecaprenyl-diphosphatase